MGPLPDWQLRMFFTGLPPDQQLSIFFTEPPLVGLLSLFQGGFHQIGLDSSPVALQLKWCFLRCCTHTLSVLVAISPYMYIVSADHPSSFRACFYPHPSCVQSSLCPFPPVIRQSRALAATRWGLHCCLLAAHNIEPPAIHRPLSVAAVMSKIL